MRSIKDSFQQVITSPFSALNAGNGKYSFWFSAKVQVCSLNFIGIILTPLKKYNSVFQADRETRFGSLLSNIVGGLKTTLLNGQGTASLVFLSAPTITRFISALFSFLLFPFVWAETFNGFTPISSNVWNTTA